MLSPVAVYKAPVWAVFYNETTDEPDAMRTRADVFGRAMDARWS